MAAANDPRNPGMHDHAGGMLPFLRRFDEAKRSMLLAQQLDPRVARRHWKLALLELQRDGNVDAARQMIDAGTIAVGERRMMEIILIAFDAWPLYRVLYGQDDLLLRQILDTPRDPAWGWWSTQNYVLAQAWGHERLGDARRATAYYDSARVAARLNEQAGLVEGANVRHSNLLHLGLSLAGLDSIETGLATLREVSERVIRLPDRFVQQEIRKVLAEAFVMAGDHESALEVLERLLADPSAVSVGLLRVDPIWDPLRTDPRFQALLEKYEN
jgi:tetratricopeptide (TPR) repeat protein